MTYLQSGGEGVTGTPRPSLGYAPAAQCRVHMYSTPELTHLGEQCIIHAVNL